VFGLYFHRIVPLMGALVAGDRGGVHATCRIGRALREPPGMAEAMRRAGLRDVRYRRFGLGTIALHVGVA